MSNKEIFIETYNKNIHRPGAEKLLAWLEGTDFFTAPASTRFHAAYEGGLLDHSLTRKHRHKIQFGYRLCHAANQHNLTARFCDCIDTI